MVLDRREQYAANSSIQSKPYKRTDFSKCVLLPVQVHQDETQTQSEEHPKDWTFSLRQVLLQATGESNHDKYNISISIATSNKSTKLVEELISVNL